MKILQVVPYYPPAHAFGGPAKVAHQICRELVKRGHNVTVFTTDARDLTSRLNVRGTAVLDGVEVRYFRNISMKLVKSLNLFVTPRILSVAIAEIRTFDLVHLHEYWALQNVVIRHNARKHNVPYILQAHGSLPRIMAGQRLKLIYDILFGYRLLRDASKVIALNPTEAQQYAVKGVPNSKIAVIPNGINFSDYDNLPPKGRFRKKFGIGNDEKIVLYLGRIHRIKGIDVLSKAFAVVIKRLVNAKLAIVGPDGGYLDELKGLIDDLRIRSNVMIPGPLYGREKLEAYVDADVCVFPSRYETFPMSLLEAYTLGKPIITSKVGGLKDLVIDRVTGLLFENEDAEELANSICCLLCDHDEAAKIALRGKQFAKENFSITKVTNRLEDLYKNIVSR